MQKGKINVQTENIFPIIKKFLYSDQEIFLRELISNAVDATQKLKTLSLAGEVKGDLGDVKIEVKIDEKKKTLTISDNGIGMTADEIDKYINQIAFSSAEEFVEKYKDKANAIIGHFGLGFYSAFMVAEKVEIFTKSYKEDAQAVKWSCNGDIDFAIEEIDKQERGTDIVLFISGDAKEYLENGKIRDLLNKYAKFMPVPIKFGDTPVFDDEGKETGERNDTIINNPEPAWTKKPNELTDKDYKDFYKELYPFTYEEPLFNIHLNVDYPFNLTGILYFPKLKNTFEFQKNKIQLYCNQVFVTDSVADIVPEFLTLLHGVIDSPDIPLNVSRSYLQSDANVKKISNHITKKVSDRLEEIFKKDRPDFEKKWDDIKVFIQYGLITDEKFYERAEKYTLLKNIEGKYFTFEEYKNRIKSSQTDKNDKVVHLYTTNKDEQYAFIEAAKERGYDVLLMDGHLDNHFINHIESKLDKVTFARVDADIIDNLIRKEDKVSSKLSEEQQANLKPLFQKQVDHKFTVMMESLSETDNPIIITKPEFLRRMKDMQKLGGQNAGFDFPDYLNLVVNSNHPLIYKINSELEQAHAKELKELNTMVNELNAKVSDLSKDEKSRKEHETEIGQIRKDISEKENTKDELLSNFSKDHKLIKQLIDLALLSQNMLTGESLNTFIKRSYELVN